VTADLKVGATSACHGHPGHARARARRPVARYGDVPQALLPVLGNGHNKQLFCFVSTSASLRLGAMDFFLLVRGFFTVWSGGLRLGYSPGQFIVTTRGARRNLFPFRGPRWDVSDNPGVTFGARSMQGG